MRRTISLDPDVRCLLKAVMKERGLSFEEALNSAVRAGLTQSMRKGRGFVQASFSLGPEQNFRWDKVMAAADAMEDEEIRRKLSLQK